MLPPELFHQVFELFRQDKPTLMSCSLVSKLWHDFAQYYLFAEITVEKHERFFAFCARNPECVAFIQALHFVQPLELLDHESSWSLDITDLTTALPLLPSLNTFSIIGCYLAREHLSLKAITPKTMNQQKFPLKRLNITPIDGCTTPNVLSALLSPFVVHSLRIVCPITGKTEEPLESPRYEALPSPPPLLEKQTQIGELVVQDQRGRSARCFQSIEHILQPGCLRALAVDTGRGNHQVSQIARLLASDAAQNLTSVHIQFVIERSRDVSLANPLSRMLGNALAQCAQLAHLRIAIEAPGWDCLPLPFFFNVLGPLPPQSLRTLAIQLSLPSSDWWEFCSTILDMPILDDLLPHPGGRFRHLHSFDLEVYKSKALPPWAPLPKSPDEYQDVQVLPRLRAAGLLRYTAVYSYYNAYQECEIFRPDILS